MPTARNAQTAYLPPEASIEASGPNLGSLPFPVATLPASRRFSSTLCFDDNFCDSKFPNLVEHGDGHPELRFRVTVNEDPRIGIRKFKRFELLHDSLQTHRVFVKIKIALRSYGNCA